MGPEPACCLLGPPAPLGRRRRGELAGFRSGAVVAAAVPRGTGGIGDRDRGRGRAGRRDGRPGAGGGRAKRPALPAAAILSSEEEEEEEEAAAAESAVRARPG